jgi:hypothetical protein
MAKKRAGAIITHAFPDGSRLQVSLDSETGYPDALDDLCNRTHRLFIDTLQDDIAIAFTYVDDAPEAAE